MESSPKPPQAAKRPVDLTLHGHTRTDDYYWLREKDNPEVICYLEAENAYTEAVLAHTDALQETLYQELVGRIKEDDQEVPVKKGEYYYYSRTEAGKQYRIYCRKQGSLDASEEVLLDLNKEAAGHGYMGLGIYSVSPDHKLLAYSLDTDGAEDYTIYVKRLATGEVLPDQIGNTSYAFAWANDNATFYYTTRDSAKRTHKLFRHTLGGRMEELFHEPDGLFSVHINKTRDDAFLVMDSSSIETSECYTLDANDPGAPLMLVQARQPGVKYSVAHRDGSFYIRTNDNARNFKLVTAPVNAPARDNWQDLVPHRAAVKLDGLELFAEHMVLLERENALQTLRVHNFARGTVHSASFPEPVYTYGVGDNPEFASSNLRLIYSSLTTPETVYDYDLNTGDWTLKKQKEVLGSFKPDDYSSERIFAEAEDGTRVPMSLVYRKGLKRDGTNPCFLYGYGSYGYTIDPGFNANRLSLLDRGFVYAIAHIRGGQSLGRHWYDDGKYLNKKNTFTDFIACGRKLIADGYSSSAHLAISGRSAGGLLIGAVLNMAPDLATAAIAGVPFMDVVTTMLDKDLPLTVGEFEEWGNPTDRAYYDYMLSYSPYDNVSPQDYPHILATAGLNDPRVHYWEPTKWVAKLRETKTDTNHVLLKTNMGAGHGGASGRYDYLRELAFEYAFLLNALGVAQPR